MVKANASVIANAWFISIAYIKDNSRVRASLWIRHWLEVINKLIRD